MTLADRVAEADCNFAAVAPPTLPAVPPEPRQAAQRRKGTLGE